MNKPLHSCVNWKHDKKHTYNVNDMLIHEDELWHIRNLTLGYASLYQLKKSHLIACK